MHLFPESVRERDLHRYYQPWLDGRDLTAGTNERPRILIPEGYHKSLTAFAQLGTLRLNARRAMVSLIDSNQQYILAEATKTLSIISHSAEQPEDEMWLGNTVISRCDAVCHHTFSSKYVVRNEKGDVWTADCMVVPDCREDPRFSEKRFVTGEPGVRFYAGVPIVTKAGHQIGVYAILDDQTREALSASDVHLMQDIAVAIMEHLELAKHSDDRNKGERMIHGLIEFVERSSLQEPRNGAFHRRTTMEKQTENANISMTGKAPEVSAEHSGSIREMESKKAPEGDSDSYRVFHRAARIIRQSTHADGVVFLDTAAAGIEGHVHENASQVASSDESQAQTGTDFDTVDSAKSSRNVKRRANHVKAFTSSSTIEDNSSMQHNTSISSRVQDRTCPVTGLSLRVDTPQLSEQAFHFTESCLERYIRRYPYGQFFNFNDEGLSIDSSDERSENTESEQSDNLAKLGVDVKRRRRRGKRLIPTELLAALPNIRTLIFLPIWDPSSERWVAGGFIWTATPGRLLSPENELPYLKAFGNCMTNQIARMNAQKSDRAKSTFIASISHELRSPLHGILGSVELLRDAVSTSDQKSLASSIETCGKTLLDTIDHVLDYAKINKLRPGSSRRKQQAEGRQKRLPSDNSILGIVSDFNLSQVVEEVCETVCAGHSFRQAHRRHSQDFDEHSDSPENNSTPQKNPDEATSTRMEGKIKHQLSVTLSFDPFGNWIVRSQPGAVRRIVMNLVGNALKYTESGFIDVALMQKSSNTHSVEFAIGVEDSGRGMSTEFQRTKLFAPFSQEDPFSTGTGLGLSIIKQIVDSLNGNIEVHSTVGVGTSVKVSLKLPAGRKENARTSQTLLQAPEALKHSTASIISNSEVGGQKLRDAIRQACHGFSIKVSDCTDLTVDKPDFLITDPVMLNQILEKQVVAKSRMLPLTVICTCTDQRAKAVVESRIKRQVTAMGWIVEVTTQPYVMNSQELNNSAGKLSELTKRNRCGPRKLARLLLDCQKRASEVRRERLLSRSISNQSSLSTKTAPPDSGSDSLTHRNSIDAAMQPGSAMENDSTVHSLSTPSRAASSSEGNRASASRVLLVDDNAINLRLLTLFAQRQKLIYTCATNGLEALNTFKSHASSSGSSSSASRAAPSPKLSKPFDLILMDISMPVMDGMEATRQIRQFEKKNGIEKSTIAALTGLASEKDQKDARDAGVDMYLVKPVKFDDIRRCFEVK